MQQVQHHFSFMPKLRSAVALALLLGASANTLADTLIKEVGFVGASSLPLTQSVLQSKIMPLGKGLVGSSVSDAQIDDTAIKMSEMIRTTGLVVSRILVTDADRAAAQKTGVLRFTVLEGRVGKISVKNTSRVNNLRIIRTLGAALCDGIFDNGACFGEQVLTSATIERATLNVSDIPGVRISPLSLNGQDVGVGETQAVVNAEAAGNRILYGVGFDTYGDKSSGRNRASVSVVANNLLGEGDVSKVSLLTTNEGVYSGDLTFSMPIGYSGFRGYLGASANYFNLNTFGSNTSLVGKSHGVTAGITYPIFRAFDYNLISILGLSTGSGKSYWNGSGLGSSSTDTFNLGLLIDDGDRHRELGQSYTRGGVNFTHGDLTLKDSASISSDATTAKTNGAYSKISYNLLRKQNIGADSADVTYLLANFHGQQASKNLNGGEKIATGGVSAVRAYPSSEPLADSGNVLQLDLRKPFNLFSQHLIPGVFLDAAQVFQNENTWQASQQSTNKRNLYGYGVSLEAQPRAGLSMGIMWAHRLGGEYSLAEPSDKSRVWATAGWQF